MMEYLGIDDYDAKNLKSKCPFHNEDTPSFIYNKKQYNAHCFGACGRSYDLIDVLMYKGMTYIEALQELFKLAKMQYSFGEHKVRTKHQYRYPKEVVCTNKNKVYEYLSLRKISKQTVDYADVREDDKGNMVFNFYDTNDVLTMVKYRPARKVDKAKGDIKTWCQKDADTSHLLFNLNKINTEKPLLICEGEIDCLSAIEAGFFNATSVPLGAGNYQWIEENWDFLEQFSSIIICSDNDEAGIKLQKEAVYRLGSWRTKVIDIPPYYQKPDGKKIRIKDLNEVLYYFGKEKVMDLILNAKDTPVDSVSDFSDIKDVDLDEIDGITTGIEQLDKNLMKLFYGTFNIVTGVNGCVDKDTQYFNGYKWVNISEYHQGDKVLQYNKDGSSTLVTPIKYHKYPCDYLYWIKSKYGVDQCVSEEHNLVYLTTKGCVQKKVFTDFLKEHNESKHGFYGKFITTFDYNGKGIALTDDEIRVMCAVVCDGNFIYEHNNKCRINIKKDRKRCRLRQLLNKAEISYEEHHYNPKDLEFSTFIFDAPLHTKSLSGDWYQCSKKQLEIIADEILYWDGHISKKIQSFSTIDKETADFIQFVFSVCGKRSVVHEYDRTGEIRGKYQRRNKEYTVTITKSKLSSIVNTTSKIEIPKVPTKDGYKYCFTVPSGMLVLRRNGRINITGNSGKSSFLSQLICECLDQNKNAFMYSGELPNFQTKNWINFILAGQRNLTEYTYGNATHYKVSKLAKSQIDKFYKGKLYIYKDGYDHRVSTILKSVEDSIRKYGTKLIIIDNLTSVNLEGNDDNKYSKQEEFVSNLIDIAKKYNVVVVLVVHPHKIDTMRRLTKMDVQGISAIIDLAHRIISLYRVTKADKKGERIVNGKKYSMPPIKYDVLCDILKDRMLGYEGSTVGLYYDKPSRRFFYDEKSLDRQYKWDKKTYTTPIPYPAKQLDEEKEVFGNINEQ